MRINLSRYPGREHGLASISVQKNGLVRSSPTRRFLERPNWPRPWSGRFPPRSTPGVSTRRRCKALHGPAREQRIHWRRWRSPLWRTLEANRQVPGEGYRTAGFPASSMFKKPWSEGVFLCSVSSGPDPQTWPLARCWVHLLDPPAPLRICVRQRGFRRLCAPKKYASEQRLCVPHGCP